MMDHQAAVSSLLLVILDCTTSSFASRQDQHITLLDHLAIFFNAHLSLNHENRLCIVGTISNTSAFLFPSPHSQTKSTVHQHIAHSNAYQQFYLMNSTFMAGVKQLIQQDHDNELAGHSCHLPSALSKALCYINRINRQNTMTKSSILVISASNDCPTHYVPLMNTIFSAQKAGITIDACKLYSDSVFLQQATHLTKGMYQFLTTPNGMIQHLLFSFLPSPDLRKSLNFPASTHVDFRSACFCHHNLVSKAYVCSVCLSIYCKWQPVCSTCETTFPTQKQT